MISLPSLSEGIERQHFKTAVPRCSMTDNPISEPTEQWSSQAKPSSEEIIRQLEQFPVEVLEASLLVLQMRQARMKL